MKCNILLKQLHTEQCRLRSQQEEDLLKHLSVLFISPARPRGIYDLEKHHSVIIIQN